MAVVCKLLVKNLVLSIMNLGKGCCHFVLTTVNTFAHLFYTFQVGII